jgi:hypothetical protein
MPRTPSGDYNLPPGQPVQTETIIDSSVHNDLASDLADAMTDSLSRSGMGGMLVPFRTVSGTILNPGFSFVADHGAGMTLDEGNGFLHFSNGGFLSLTIKPDGIDVPGKIHAENVEAIASGTAAPTDTDNALTAGQHSNKNIKISTDSIQAADNGVASGLHLNPHGGKVYLNGDELTPGDSFQKSDHVRISSGTPDALKPIILNGSGKVDMTMCDCDALVFVAGWTPTPGNEYPDTTGYEFGAFWIIENVATTYTFNGGDLVGRTCENGYVMIFGSDVWGLTRNSVSITAFYRVDGSIPITAPFAGGGQQLKSLADGTDPTDAVTVQQLGNQDYLPINGKAADSERLDNHDSTYFAEATHNHDADYLGKTAKASDSELLDGREGDSFVFKEGDVMTGNLAIQGGTDIDYFQINRSDSTIKMIIGSTGAEEEISLRLYDNSGSAIASGLVFIDDGSIRFSVTPTVSDGNDVTPKSYVDAQDALSYLKTEHLDIGTGTGDAGKPVILNSNGKLDQSLLDISTFVPAGNWTPTAGAEYPDPSGHLPGTFWVVAELTADYTFTGGSLSGMSTKNGDLMIWADPDWALYASSIDPDIYYKIDGTVALTAALAGGGQQLKNIADGTDNSDAVTLSQLNAYDPGGYLPVDGKAADTNLFDGRDSTDFADASHNHDGYHALQKNAGHRVDLDLELENGWYTCDNNTLNTPDGAWGTVVIFGDNLDFLSQLFVAIDGKTSVRVLSSGTWSPWVGVSDSDVFVRKDGDTMTGNLTVGTGERSPSVNIAPEDDTGYSSLILRDGSGFSRGTIYIKNSTDYMGIQKQDASNTTVCEIALEDDGNISLQIANVMPANSNHLTVKQYVDDMDALSYKKTDFINVSVGAGDGGKPILLNSQGHVDPSMLDVSVFHYVGSFTPADGAEYPDISGETHGAFWVVQGLTDEYVFVGGDLTGLPINNGDFMVWASSGWSIMVGEMNPLLYYRLDGSQALTDHFAGGGKQLKNIADGTDTTDAVTLAQLNSYTPPGNWLPVDGKAVDSDLLDGEDSAFYATATHDHEGVYLPISGTAADSAMLGGLIPSEYALTGHNHDGLYFLKTEHLSVSAGVTSAGKPITLNSLGQIDSSMLDVSVFYYVGEFTPATGNEYPDRTGETTGAFWVVQGLSADYTFDGGDLTGRVIGNGDFMVWATGGWSIMASEMNPTLYYRLDGTQPLTGDFQGGDFLLKHVGAGTESTDGINLGQADGRFLAIGGKAADSTLLDGHAIGSFVRTDDGDQNITGNLSLTPSGSCSLALWDGSAQVDSGKMRFVSSDNLISMELLRDDDAAHTAFLTVDRTGMDVDSVNIESYMNVKGEVHAIGDVIADSDGEQRSLIKTMQAGDRGVDDCNFFTESGTFGTVDTTLNTPIIGWGTLLVQKNFDIGSQIYTDYGIGIAENITTWTRTWMNDGALWSDWKELGASSAKVYKSPMTAITPNGYHVFPHGLGQIPELVTIKLKCIVAEHGWVVGDEIFVTVNNTSSDNTKISSVHVTATDVKVKLSENENYAFISTNGNGQDSWDGCTNTNWNFQIAAYALLPEVTQVETKMMTDEVLCYFGGDGAIYSSLNIAGFVNNSSGSHTATFAAPMPDSNYISLGGGRYSSGDCSDGNVVSTFNDLGVSQVDVCTRKFDGDGGSAVASGWLRIVHPTATGVHVAENAPIDTNVGVIKNPDSSIRIARAAKGYTVQDVLDRMQLTGVIMDSSNVPTSFLLRDAWRLNSATQIIYIDLPKAKEIAIEKNERVASRQLAEFRPAWEEAVDNDDTAQMAAIKSDRQNIRNTLAMKIDDINNCTTDTQIEAYLP